MKGIYKIVCLVNDKSYVGQTHNYKNRKWSHKTGLRSGKHHNKKLQKDFDTYGEEKFIFEFLEECSTDYELDIKEDYWINKLNSIENGYNLKTGGVKHNKLSTETKKDISKALKGIEFSDIHKKRISEKLKGREIKPESIAKLKKTFKERNVSVGSNNPAHILCEKDVIKIKLALASGISPMELKDIFGVSRNTIYEIKRLAIWENVASELNYKVKNGDKEEFKKKCDKAKELFYKGYSVNKISQELKMSPKTIKKLIN